MLLSPGSSGLVECFRGVEFILFRPAGQGQRKRKNKIIPNSMASVGQFQQVFGAAVARMGQTMIQVLQRRLHRQQQPQPPSGTPAQSAQNSAREKKQLNVRGFENIVIFTGGDDKWQTWSLKVSTAVPGTHNAEAEFMEVDPAQCRS